MVRVSTGGAGGSGGDSWRDRERPTILSRMGFDDPEAKTPEHDAMSLAMLDPVVVCNILTECGILPFGQQRLSKELPGRIESIDGHVVHVSRKWHCTIDKSGDDIRLRECSSFHWNAVEAQTDYRLTMPWSEQYDFSTLLDEPAYKGTGEYRTIVGFIDGTVSVVAKSPYTGEAVDMWRERVSMNIDDGIRSVENRRSVRGEVELRSRAFIEAKVTVDRLMDTMRQIKVYRDLVGGPQILWCPVIPDNLANAFSSQGILVAKTPVPQ